MGKIKKGIACIAAGLAVVAMLGGIFVGTQYTSAENDAPEVQTASSLWENVEGIELEDNVDVPDYMKYGNYATDYKKPEEMKTVSSDAEQNLQPWELNGLLMTSEADNRSISFKNTLDISGFTEADDLITLAPIPAVRGVLDYTEVEIKLQDADDENNYLKITLVNRNLYWADVRILADTPTASLYTATGIAAFKGYTRDAVDVNEPSNRHRPMKLRYDTTTNKVSFVGPAGGMVYMQSFHNENQVGYGNAWWGFKTGRVNLSVTMRGFSAQKAQLMILSVCGQGMNSTALEDKASPVFSFGEEAKVIPSAQVGKNYPLYVAQSLDVVSGSITPVCTVVSPSGENVEIKDGGFTPTKGGYYTLTYEATDVAGNMSRKTFKVFATSALNPITIEAERASGDFYVGNHIPVSEATAQGGSGMLDVTMDVVRVGGAERIIVEEGAFTPLLGGTYCVVYTATDYLGNTATKTLSYNVKQSEKIEKWTVESLTELKRLFDGVPVMFPQPVAYDYVSYVGNKLNAKYEIAVYDKQGTREVLEGGIFTPDKEKYGDSVKVEYIIYSNKDTTKENGYLHEYEVPLYAREADGTATGQVEDYFAYDKETFTTSYNPDNNSEYIKFSTDQEAAEQSITFVNPVVANGFSLAFAFPAGEQNWSSFTISLRDSVDSRIGFDMELTPRDATRMFLTSGGTKYSINGAGNTFDETTGEEVPSKTPLALTYKNGKIVDYTNALVFRPKINVDGKQFNGFTSNRVYVTFTFKNITGVSSLMLAQLCTQTLYADYNSKGEMKPFEDLIEPTIALLSDVGNTHFINQTVEIPIALGYDVLTPYIPVYVTVKGPNGEKIYNKQLVAEGMTFELETRGKYTITYEAEDTGNPTRKVYTIRTKDDAAPTVAVSVTQLQGKVGEKMSLPTALVLDDVDQNPRLFIMIVTPKAKIIMLGESTAENVINSYTFKEVGKYYIRYYALDASYNVTLTDVPVVISK